MRWYQLYREDLKRYQEQRQNGSAFITLMAEQGLWALMQYRIASAVYHGKWPQVVKDPLILGFMVWRKLVEIVTGISLSHQAHIGPGLYLGHFGNIFIGGDVIIGEGCTIAQGVTIGVSGRGVDRGMPTLGDRVYVAVNAVVAGKITVGDDVAIAANSLVTGHVPSGSVVIGVPARIVSRAGSKDFLRPQSAVDQASCKEEVPDRRPKSVGLVLGSSGN
jgi:serine O-acetyltransferase